MLEFIEEWNASSAHVLVKTSGSTGQPKKISILKEHMIASAKATGQFLGLEKGNTALLCLSMDTIGGRMMVVRSLVLDLNLIVSDVTSTPLTAIKEEIDFAAMVPMQVQKSLDEDSTKISEIKKLIIGGGPVSPTLIDDIQEIPTQVYHTFGMTETISHIAMRQLNHPLEDDFKCLPNVQIGSRNGSLLITAPDIGVTDLHTNDEVTLTSESSFRWLGRTDFVINSGGIKLHPEEIESKLSSLIAQPFFVFGEKDDLLGEKLILLIEHSEELNLNKSDFQSVLANRTIPKEIRYTSQFEYTKSGKINRLISQELPNVAQQVL
ncbi:MAG: AMP-binding protein [Crocinitomicaceae bacterium]|nr:AMP-binding protein [Crocinitomicaceae bacterium]